MMKFSSMLLVVLITISLLSCQSNRLTSKKLNRLVQQSTIFSQNHTGFALYDLAEHKVLAEYNANRYFQPASNTKLYTYYVSQKTLGDSIPALQYVRSGDSLIVWGTGDPSFLNPDLPKSKVLDFLKDAPETIYFSNDNFTSQFYGPGWAWDDYNDYYATEISAFPIHGNIVRFKGDVNNSLRIEPRFFADKTYNWSHGNSFSVQRDLTGNLFSYPAGKSIKPNYEQDIPFKTSPELTVTLLKDILQKEVVLINKALPNNTKTLYSLPADSLYTRMLHVSDNMIAEQLMVLTSHILAGELNVKTGIAKAKSQYLQELPDAPSWVDGSGLSRYNLFTPRDMIYLLGKIYEDVPQAKLFKILPAAGKSGTIKNIMKTDEAFIFAKSGSFSNNYNLSGYILTRKGKVLSFSLMNNNFVKPMSEIRKEVSQLLTTIHEKW